MSSAELEALFNLAWTKNLSSGINEAYQEKSILSTRNCLIIVAYSLIILVSVFGNSLVCNIVLRNKCMRSTTYVFIANLALSDLIMTVLNIPFNVTLMILTNWPFGSFMCSFVPLVQVTTVYVSTFTMTCIAVDRYKVICKPLKPRMKSSQALKVTTFVWLLAFLLSLPYAIYNKVITIFTYRRLTRCRTIFPEMTRHWIELLTLLAQYVIPLSVTGVLYCLIVAHVWSRSSLGVVTEAQLVTQAKAKRKTIKMLVLVVVFFALCWLPLNVFHVLREFVGTEFLYTTSGSTTNHSTNYFLCHWLAMSSVCYNPFIYCWLNEHFRKGAIRCFSCIRTFSRNLNSTIRSTRKLEQAHLESATTQTQFTECKTFNEDWQQCYINRVESLIVKRRISKQGNIKTNEPMIPLKSYYIPLTTRNTSLNSWSKNKRHHRSLPNIHTDEKVANDDSEKFDEKEKKPLSRCHSWNQITVNMV